MNRNNYLVTLYRNTNNLANAPSLSSQFAQVRAKALQYELLPEIPDVGFTFDIQHIWNLYECIFVDSSFLLREHSGESAQLKKWIRTSAQAFEFLSRLLPDERRVVLLVNSALCYQIAGYKANSQCLAKCIKGEYPDTLLEEVDEYDRRLARYFIAAVTDFLRSNVSSLQQVSTQALLLIRESQSIFLDKLKEDPAAVLNVFGLLASSYFQKAMDSHVKYCLEGDPEVFRSSVQDVCKSHQYFQKAQEVSLDVIASELRTSLLSFEERSTWYNIRTQAPDLLDNPVWRTYLRNIAFEQSITEFWPSQIKAIQEGVLSNDDSYIIQMPTSAGKTLIAELTILSALTSTDEARCLYIAPYRALVNEIESGLSDTLGAVGYRVSTLLGGFELDSFQNFLVHESDVLIATPEKTELLFRTHPEYFENLAVIIVDEGHIVDEGIPSESELVGDKTLLSELEQNNTLGRGPLLELLITRLKLRFSAIRFIFLSAVMPRVNANDFISWLSCKREQPLSIEEEERPSRQVIAKFEWRSPQNGELEYVSLPMLQDYRRHPWVPCFIQRKQYYTGDRTPTGRRQRRSWPEINNKSQTTAMLAARFAKSGPVLVFCAQRSDVHTVVENLITSLQYLEASEELLVREMKRIETPNLESYHLALDWLGADHLLTQALRYSVALHYGPLPEPLRQSIEDEFRQGKIKILVSTNTLGQGVNLPVKTAIIYSLVRQWVENDEEGNGQLYRQEIKKRDFWNICGRAGRAGKETEGQIIFVVNSLTDQSLFLEFTDRANLEQVHSALFKLLEALIERRIDQDSLLGYLDSQTLALIVEEVIDAEDDTVITQFLQRSLVGVQAAKSNKDLSPLVATVKETIRWINEEVPEASLRVYSSTGLRVNSCKALEEGVELFLQEIGYEIPDVEFQKLECNQTLLHIAFRSCDNLPEMRLAHTIKYEGPQNEFLLISEWVKGVSVAQIRSLLWVNGESQNLSQYISDQLMYKLPWGFNGFLRILAFKLGREYHDLPLSWQQLPSMLKAGVDNVFSCWAFGLGASTRSLALQIADLYPHKEKISFMTFLQWLANLPFDFFIYKLKGLDFEKQKFANQISKLMPDKELLEFIRTESNILSSPVRGIPYENRALFASQVQENDDLILEYEPENPFDPHAIRVVHRGNHIGYVERGKAKVLSKEIKIGRIVSARAEYIRHPTDDYPFPWIDMKIQLD